PAGVVMRGPTEFSIKAWQLPTPGSRPHDPLAAADGSLWYTGQMANVLGRLDPNTGQFKEYPLKTAHSGPHGLVEDKAGNIWFTGNHAALVGKLNPKTGEVTEYKMPDPQAKDPHTLIIEKRGTVWLSVQNANRIWRLEPKSCASIPRRRNSRAGQSPAAATSCAIRTSRPKVTSCSPTA